MVNAQLGPTVPQIRVRDHSGKPYIPQVLSPSDLNDNDSSQGLINKVSSNTELLINHTMKKITACKYIKNSGASIGLRSNIFSLRSTINLHSHQPQRETHKPQTRLCFRYTHVRPSYLPNKQYL